MNGSRNGCPGCGRNGTYSPVAGFLSPASPPASACLCVRRTPGMSAGPAEGEWQNRGALVRKLNAARMTSAFHGQHLTTGQWTQ